MGLCPEGPVAVAEVGPPAEVDPGLLRCFNNIGNELIAISANKGLSAAYLKSRSKIYDIGTKDNNYSSYDLSLAHECFEQKTEVGSPTYIELLPSEQSSNGTSIYITLKNGAISNVSSVRVDYYNDDTVLKCLNPVKPTALSRVDAESLLKDITINHLPTADSVSAGIKHITTVRFSS